MLHYHFRRHAFLLMTLFGASPAVCSSFVEGRQHDLQTLAEFTSYMPYGTSLRMGRLGYQSDAQSSLAVSYNSLDGYAASLQDALTRSYPAYKAIGIQNPGGDYNQLSDSLLQIENEFYGTIRPKRVIHPGERPLHALRERGVEYVEVRLMDLDPFVPVGITAATTRFIDVFLLHCLMSDSPNDTPEEIAALSRNQHQTAARGREPGLMLEREGAEVSLKDWGLDVIGQCAPIAAARIATPLSLRPPKYPSRLTIRRRDFPAPRPGYPTSGVASACCPSHRTAQPTGSRAQPQRAPGLCRWRSCCAPPATAAAGG